MKMLKQLYFLEDIMERYHYKDKKAARRIMAQMGATGKPAFVYEENMIAWEQSRVRMPAFMNDNHSSGKPRLIPKRK